ATLRGLADQVRGVRLVGATGEVVEADQTRHRELFEVARLGLGSVGVLTAVTLRCVPAFTLTADERPRPLGAVLESLDDEAGPVHANDHFEFYWFPYTDIVLTKANNRAGAAGPLSPVRRVLDDEILSNTVFEVTNRLCTGVKALTPKVNWVAARALSARRYTAPSHEVFATPRRVRFREMEYALPAHAVVPALRAVNTWLRHTGETVPFPVEVRFAAADDVWLSTAYGRDTAYVAVHQYHRLPFARYFRAVEDIMRSHDGRPHWGKMHRRRAADLAPVYPRFDDAARVRRAADPRGLFADEFADRALGAAPGHVGAAPGHAAAAPGHGRGSGQHVSIGAESREQQWEERLAWPVLIAALASVPAVFLTLLGDPVSTWGVVASGVAGVVLMIEPVALFAVSTDKWAWLRRNWWLVLLAALIVLSVVLALGPVQVFRLLRAVGALRVIRVRRIVTAGRVLGRRLSSGPERWPAFAA